MKKILFIVLFLAIVSRSAVAQSNRLIGRWNGIIGTQNITIVFTSGGKGIWKASHVFNPPMGDCKCNVETSSQ